MKGSMAFFVLIVLVLVIIILFSPSYAGLTSGVAHIRRSKGIVLEGDALLRLGLR